MNPSRREFLATGLSAAALACASCAIKPQPPALEGEDGSNLWLRYRQNPGPIKIGEITFDSNPNGGPTPTRKLIEAEWARFRGPPDPAGARVVLSYPLLASADADLSADEFGIWSGKDADGRLIFMIVGTSDVPFLHATFHLIRLLQTHQPVDNLRIRQRPRFRLRFLNHWDNLDGTIERGYAGRSLWNWAELPEKLHPRLTAYARANASIGINGTVLNNVNASATFLSSEYLRKTAAIADVFRPWGIRVFLSANFSAPVILDKLPTADPLNPQVAAWWRKKADEIYALIPDFGGFLVKANSEGQPGPQDFGRTHADGANMMADALGERGSIIWRAFIYDEDVDPDRAKRAYIEFTKLEGQFRPNVLLQVKNGPIDFQPREPFHPLFGALPKTPVIAELQATQEYLGQAKHLVYLGTMWKEFLESDTVARGEGSTVARILEGKVLPGTGVTGMACVLNTGTDVNWCGHDFSQANWYAFGRLAWDHTLSAETIAEEWIRQTFTQDDTAVDAIRGIMMKSRENFVSYTMPLGLHHLIGDDPATGDFHYSPKPWNDTAPRRDWTATYYHQAGPTSIGFDRTRTGDKAVDQYFPPVADIFNDPARCPEEFLLWFHHLPWDHTMRSGKTLWQELCRRYTDGANSGNDLLMNWSLIRGSIDPARYDAILSRLHIQIRDARLWRDRILAYFQKFIGMPISGAAAPAGCPPRA